MDKKTIELEKYKKGCIVRDNVIGELREEIAGQYQLINILSAYVTVLTGKRKKTINKQALAECIGNYEIAIKQDEENYIIKAVEIKKE